MARARRPNAVYEQDHEYLTKKLREARAESGLTQAEVARKLDRPHSIVSKIELRDRQVTALELYRLAVIYDKPLDYFYPPRRRGGRSASG